MVLFDANLKTPGQIDIIINKIAWFFLTEILTYLHKRYIKKIISLKDETAVFKVLNLIWC